MTCRYAVRATRASHRKGRHASTRGDSKTCRTAVRRQDKNRTAISDMHAHKHTGRGDSKTCRPACRHETSIARQLAGMCGEDKTSITLQKETYRHAGRKRDMQTRDGSCSRRAGERQHGNARLSEESGKWSLGWLSGLAASRSDATEGRVCLVPAAKRAREPGAHAWRLSFDGRRCGDALLPRSWPPSG